MYLYTFYVLAVVLVVTILLMPDTALPHPIPAY